MASGQQVLLVDGISETEEVLKAVLEPRGLQVNRIRGHCANRSAEAGGQPRVVVIHTDSDPSGQGTDEGWPGIPRVIIGSSDRTASSPSSSTKADQYLPQPFHYTELIQAIEQLLHSHLS